MKTYTPDELQAILRAHIAWLRNEINGERAYLSGANLSSANLRGADLRGADLSSANLSSANLRGADLSSANLSSANLRGADLRDANLSSANLSSADLRDADLRDADLRGADLSSADLRGADLSSANLSSADLRDADLRGANLRGAKEMDTAIMPGGYSFAFYKAEVVPALLTAGGKSLADVVGASWDCHSWDNCPMAVAFDVHSVLDIPPLYREHAELFINLFDAGLIPKPEIPGA